jgi:hypothetical protein
VAIPPLLKLPHANADLVPRTTCRVAHLVLLLCQPTGPERIQERLRVLLYPVNIWDEFCERLLLAV